METTAPATTAEQTKVCKGCGKTLPLSAFAKCKTLADGYENKCKDCRNEQARQNRKNKAGGKLRKYERKAAPAPKAEKPAVQAVSAPKGISSHTDAELVAELRKRGYKVQCTKEVTTTIEL